MSLEVTAELDDLLLRFNIYEIPVKHFGQKLLKRDDISKTFRGSPKHLGRKLSSLQNEK